MRAAIIDDHQLVRDSLRRLLVDDLGFEDVIEAADLETGLERLAEAGDVELIVVDLNLPGNGGPQSMGALAEAFPASRVLVVSGSDSRQDVLACLAAGVDGYAPKALPVAELVGAIRDVLAGRVYVPRALARRGAVPTEPAPASAPRPTAPAVEHLTPRQREVLDQLLRGQSSKEIARALDVAEGTVKIHLAAIYRALGVRSRAEAMARLMTTRA
jgi:DNA-binding NarL/FixJ family response regulator